MQVFVCLACRHRGQDQQDDVVDQNQSNWKQETPKHWLPVVKVFILIQSSEPAARRVNEGQRLEMMTTSNITNTSHVPTIPPDGIPEDYLACKLSPA